MPSTVDLLAARQKMGWTQTQAAAMLGVTQAYLSLLEAGRRPVTLRLLDRIRRLYVLGPLSLPLLEKVDLNPALLPADLGGLGCPGFVHLLPRRWLNPAQVLLLALRQPHLHPKLAEALPWVVVEYSPLNWPWLVDHTKLADCQNRLGFVVTLARQLATLRRDAGVARVLGINEQIIEDSKLAREDEFGLGRPTDARRGWLRAHKSNDARRWNLLTEIRAAHLAKYVAVDNH